MENIIWKNTDISIRKNTYEGFDLIDYDIVLNNGDWFTVNYSFDDDNEAIAWISKHYETYLENFEE